MQDALHAGGKQSYRKGEICSLQRRGEHLQEKEITESRLSTELGAVENGMRKRD